MELHIVSEQYARMGNEELILFAKNESQHLTIESFGLLNQEFEKRKLDIGVLESVETDKALSELTKQTTFEKITAYEFTETLWHFAFDEKAKGKNNLDIYNGLLRKGVDEQYAFMLIQSLETKANELIDDFNTDIIIGWIISSVGFILIVLAAADKFSGIYGIYGLLLMTGGVIRLYKNYSRKKKYELAKKNIEAEQMEYEEDTSWRN